MENAIKSSKMRRTSPKRLLFSLAMLAVFCLAYTGQAKAARTSAQANQDSVLMIYQIGKLSPSLHYPQSVARFYKANGSKRIWVFPDTVKSPIWQAMILLDCVLQFGLNRQDFHPDELSYQQLQPLAQQTGYAIENERTRFDIYLTDALLTMINHLHYGKFNPLVTTKQIEKGTLEGFRAEGLLSKALHSKAFMDTVVTAQPRCNAYKELQSYLHLIKGQYIDDCYEFPEGEAKKIALNMERLRWLGDTEAYFLQINIPSFQLKLFRGDSVHTFKVIVGKPGSPSPELQSRITYLSTAPDWSVPQKIFYNELLPKALRDSQFLSANHYAIYDSKNNLVNPTNPILKQIASAGRGYSLRQSPGCDNSLGGIVFRFPNSFDIYLHDTPDQKLFKTGRRVFSHGCIRVENAQLLAGLLLHNDGAFASIPRLKAALATMKQEHFTLRHPVPIKITYLTCEMTEGTFSSYPDIYHKDKALEELMFPKASLLVKGG